MDVCLRLFCVCVVGSGLATGWSPVQGVRTTVLGLRNWSETKHFTDAPCSKVGATGKRELSRVESYVTTDGQSASVSWNKAPIWGLRPDFYYCQTVASLLMWGALSDQRTGVSFTIAAGPRQRNHSRVRVPWDSLPYCTVSDSRLPFSSPPTTLRQRERERLSYIMWRHVVW
jgi:hypothetical protein